MQALEVKPASLADAHRLAALHQAGFADAWSAESLAELMIMPGARTLLIQREAQPLGFVLARIGGGEAEIITICIAPEARRQGAARLLMTDIMARASAQDAQDMFLEVADDNRAAISLYRQCGFTEVGRRPGYYARGGNRVDALILRCSLAPMP